MLAPRNGGIRFCRQTGANFAGVRAALQGKMLAPRNGGIRFCRQTGANSSGVRAALQGKMLAPRNGGTRLCRQWGANSASDRLPFPIFSALGRHGLGARIPAKPCSFVPFAPSLRTFSALGRRLESRKGEWPRPFSFSSFPQ